MFLKGYRMVRDLWRGPALVSNSSSGQGDTSPVGGSRQGFSKDTTSETKNGSLLIEVFSKLFNTQNYGH
jgi:hypothetical protein